MILLSQMGTTPEQQKLIDALERHRHVELDNFDVEGTLKTMTNNPYILWIATVLGGDDFEGVKQFYSNMLSEIPQDMKWIPISQTVGTEQIVIECILEFTHSIVMKWILPGLNPTGRKVQIPLVIIVLIKDDKVHCERIYWDQASTLVQLGVLDVGKLPIVGSVNVEKLLKLTAEQRAHQ